jgi:NAD+ synthase
MQTQLSAADTALCDDIAVWLRHHLDATGAERFVLGLSGGIDSATVCALCVRAAGADRVLGAIMPAHSNPTDAEHAVLVAQTFGVEIVRVDLTPVIGAFLVAMPAGNDPDVSASESRPESRATLANANIKPRLRMTTLYYLANLHNGLVVGTGNKSEAMVGYFTKYGDGGVDLLPIADLYKHEVRRLARVLGVPEAIITKPPSAGLWVGQTDEVELGLSYEQLDAALAAIESGNKTGVDAAVRVRVQSLVNASAHKRQAIPVFRRLAPET